MMTTIELRNAALEVIYSWNRTEGYYHRYFSLLDEIYFDKDLLPFFTSKIFEAFLRDYSIRRNLLSGYQSVDNFLSQIIQFQFIQKVKSGEIEIIDSLSFELKKSQISTKRQTKSLLSKIAFLVNPEVFSLFDTLSRKSLKELLQGIECNEKADLSEYRSFIKKTNTILEKFKGEFDKQQVILSQFKGTTAYDFFKEHPDAFNRRIFDKYLWIRQQNLDENGRKIYNEPYKRFLELKQ